MVMKFFEKVSPNDLKNIEKKADADLKPLNIDVDLQKNHFKDRVNDPRNDPAIKPSDISSLLAKVKKAKGQKIKQKKDGEAVLKDKESKVNIPVALKTTRDGSGKKITSVVAKTIMRKKDFKTSKSSPIIAYEETEVKESSGKSNPVAKYMRTFNKATVQRDRKKALKKGDRKHKGRYEEVSEKTFEPHMMYHPKTGDAVKAKTYQDHLDLGKKGYQLGENLDAAQKEKQAANLKLKHANQRVQLTKRHEKEKDSLMKEETISEASAPSTIRVKGKKYYSTGKKGKDMKTGAPSFEYSSDMDGDDHRVWYNAKTKKVANESTAAYAKTQSNIRRKNKAASMTSSDKNKMGKLSALMKKQKREEVEQVDEATSKKLLDKMKELGGGQLPRSSVELRKLKAKAQDELRGARAAKKAEPKKVSKTSKGKTHTGSGDPADRNIIMQLRKAQDALSPNTFDILVSPAGKTVNLPKAKIDALLKKHDTIQKPRDKRMFNVQLTKALRKMSK